MEQIPTTENGIGHALVYEQGRFQCSCGAIFRSGDEDDKPGDWWIQHVLAEIWKRLDKIEAAW